MGGIAWLPDGSSPNSPGHLSEEQAATHHMTALFKNIPRVQSQNPLPGFCGFPQFALITLSFITAKYFLLPILGPGEHNSLNALPHCPNTCLLSSAYKSTPTHLQKVALVFPTPPHVKESDFLLCFSVLDVTHLILLPVSGLPQTALA
jgi:hypothetical protein